MIKIKKGYIDYHGVITVGPHEALKALEEQAPEVLREWIYKKPSTINPGTVRVINEWVDPDRRKHRTYICVDPFDEDSGHYDDEVCRNTRSYVRDLIRKSPWIKVSDQSPPKDGSVIGDVDNDSEQYVSSFYCEGIHACHSFEEAEDQEYEWVDEQTDERTSFTPFYRWMLKPE